MGLLVSGGSAATIIGLACARDHVTAGQGRFRGLPQGTHEGTFIRIPPTGLEATVPHMYLCRLDAAQITEYAAVRDDFGMLS